MKITLYTLVPVVVILFVLCFFLGNERIAAGKNPVLVINLLTCGVFGLGLVITAKTTGGKKWLNFAMITLCITGIVVLLTSLTHLPALVSGRHMSGMVNWWGIINFATFVASIPIVFVSIIRYCYQPGTKIGAHQVGMLKFALIWCITISMCGQIATASETQFSGGSNIIQLNTTASDILGPGFSDPDQPDIWFCLGILVVVVVLLGVIVWVCRVTHMCGAVSMPPPLSGPNMAAVTASAQLHSAKDAMSADDQRLDNLLSQVVTIDNIAIWTNTCGVHDPYVDTEYAFTNTSNYSVVGTTDISRTTGWHTLYTIVQWQTADPINPFVCQVIYTNQVKMTGNGNFVTNGIAIGTNRWQFTTDGNANLISKINFGNVYRIPVDSSMTAPRMFFRTWINTNHVSTTGP